MASTTPPSLRPRFASRLHPAQGRVHHSKKHREWSKRRQNEKKCVQDVGVMCTAARMSRLQCMGVCGLVQSRFLPIKCFLRPCLHLLSWPLCNGKDHEAHQDLQECRHREEGQNASGSETCSSDEIQVVEKISYIRDKNAVPSRGQRKEQIKWKRTLPELLEASDRGIIRLLIADKILPKWDGKRCPSCSKGTLSKLFVEKRTGLLKHRCSRKTCQLHMNPHHLHPLFIQTPETQATSDLWVGLP